MSTARTSLELRLLAALRTIAAYDSPDRLRRRCERDYGLGFEETLEYAYDNVLNEAKAAIRGVRTAKPDSTVPA